MQEIEQRAIETYQNNLIYLEQNHKDLFDRVHGLSMMIELGEYVERYHLEYIKEDKSFDILDTVTNTYLYNKESSKYDKEAVKNTNKDKLNTFEVFDPNFYNIPYKLNVSENMSLNEKYAIEVSNDISEYTSIFKYSTKDPNKKFKKIEKFIFMGTLLGSHIEKIHKKLKSYAYFICDANLEVFRLSLFVCKYSKVGKESRLFFSIMEEQNKFISDFDKFWSYGISANYILKYYSSNYNIQDYFDRLLNVMLLKSPFKFTYVKYLKQLLNPSFNHMRRLPVFETLKKHNALKDVPVLFVAAGPSLAKNIEWLKKNKENFFIVSIGASVKRLIENDIKPDLITSGDAGEHTVFHFPEEIRDKTYNIPFLTTHMTHDDVLDCFKTTNTFLYEAMSRIKETSALIEGASVGEASLQLLFIMGANKVYLLGTDLALDQETGQTHISDYEYGKKFEISEDELDDSSFMNKGEISSKDTIIKIKGNHREKVSTTTVFARSVIHYNTVISNAKLEDPSIKLYNLNDGAYLEGALPTLVESVSIEENKKKVDILSFLNSSSTTEFSERDMETIKLSIDYINVIIEKVNKIEKLKVKSYKSFLTYRGELLNFISRDLQRFKGLNLSEIFGLYIATTESYLGYNFNDTKKINEANWIKKVNQVWCRQIKNIANTYKEIILENFHNEFGISYEVRDIDGYDDLELNIKRESKLRYHISYPKSLNIVGTLFILPSFGEEASVEFQKKLILSISKKYNLLVVFVEYHGVFSRLQNNATLISKDSDSLSALLNKYEIDEIEEDFLLNIKALSEKMVDEKNSKKILTNVLETIDVIAEPAKKEYQNYGVLQSVDVLTVLSDILKDKIFEKVLKVQKISLVGNDFGGYVANLVAKFMPNIFDTIIDNSCYINPPLSHVLAKGSPEELIINVDSNILLKIFTKTFWNEDEDSLFYFSKSAQEIRNLASKKEKNELIRSTFISYHSKNDKLVDIEEKKSYLENLESAGAKTKLVQISDPSEVDGVFIKNLEHTMGISIKELVDNNILEIINKNTLISKNFTQKNIELISEEATYSFVFKNNKFIFSIKN